MFEDFGRDWGGFCVAWLLSVAVAGGVGATGGSEG